MPDLTLTPDEQAAAEPVYSAAVALLQDTPALHAFAADGHNRSVFLRAIANTQRRVEVEPLRYAAFITALFLDGPS